MTAARAGWAAVALVLALTGCGVPTGGEPSTIPPSDVPYGLASPSPSATPPPPAESVVDTSRVHWLTAGDTLVPRVREVSGTTRRERLVSLLGQLAAGPTEDERGQRLSSALPPAVRLGVTGLRDGTATIDLDASAQPPAGVSGRQAVAQIVLTATSVPGVDSVLLELGGEPIEAPLAAGDLTARPLTAQDYATLAAPLPAAPGTTEVPPAEVPPGVPPPVDPPPGAPAAPPG